MKTCFVRNYIHQELLDKTLIIIKDTDKILNINGSNYLFGESLLQKIFINDNIQNEYDYICLIDEDCKITDMNIVYLIIEYMNNSVIDIIGPSDGTMYNTWTRIHRNDIPNLFFTIFKTEKLRNININEYNSWKSPTYDIKLESTNFEPYYHSLTYYVYNLGMKYEPLMKYENKSEGIFTYIIWNNKRFGIHTWYSRLYGKDKEHTERINKLLS